VNLYKSTTSINAEACAQSTNSKLSYSEIDKWDQPQFHFANYACQKIFIDREISPLQKPGEKRQKNQTQAFRFLSMR
jgi:hypothetical protein